MRHVMLFVLMSLVYATSALGAVTVTGDGGQGIAGAYYEIIEVDDNLYDVKLKVRYNPQGNTVFEVNGFAVDRLRNLYIDVDGPAAGSPVIVRVFDFGIVDNIEQRGTAETLLNAVERVGQLGSVQVEAIGNLIIDGDIIGPILATTGDNPSRGVTRAIAEGGSILGDILAPNGRVLIVNATGTIGTTGNPIEISGKYSMDEVVAPEVYASISTRLNGGTGNIQLVEVEEFYGVIDVYEITDAPDKGVFISEVFEGTMYFGNDFEGTHRRINLPEAGLNGQIIFNGDNLASPAWTRPVTFDDSGPNELTLDSPGYSILPAILGGGSIGLAPFQLHDEACTPPNGDMRLVNNSFPLTQVRLRHYGPLFISGGGDPVTVERRAVGSGGAYTDVTSDFSFSIDGSDTRTLIVTADTKFDADYEYRITETTALVCSGVTGTPPVDWAGPYILTVEQTCPPDLANSTGDGVDGQVNVSDLFILLASWGDCGSPCPPNCRGDISGFTGQPDCIVNVFDLFALLSEWGPCYMGQSQAPETIDDCYDLYGEEEDKLEACIEAILIMEGYNIPE